MDTARRSRREHEDYSGSEQGNREASLPAHHLTRAFAADCASASLLCRYHHSKRLAKGPFVGTLVRAMLTNDSGSGLGSETRACVAPGGSSGWLSEGAAKGTRQPLS